MSEQEVGRYDPFGYDGMSAMMKEDAHGDWVRGEDYDALHAEAEVLRAENMQLLEEWGRIRHAAKAFADAARPNIYPCPDKPHSLFGKLQALDDALAAAQATEVQGERQEAVAWALANSADEIGGFAPIYYTKEGAISWANGRNIFPLYTTPQPCADVRALVSADDVRDACANAVSVFAEETNADQCREVAEYMREVLLAQIARRQAQPQ